MFQGLTNGFDTHQVWFWFNTTGPEVRNRPHLGFNWPSFCPQSFPSFERIDLETFNFTFDSYPLNLAFEEVFLNECRQAPGRELLRVWHPKQYGVVVGSGSKVSQEVQIDRCREQGVGVFRRNSGGTAIVAGPGCLMYGVVLSLEKRPFLADVQQAHQLVMGKIQETTRFFCPNVEINGICDLSLEGQKFSGNALKITRTHVLYHGTILFDFDLDIVSKTMGTPPREPQYRAGRSHRKFVRNLPIANPGQFPATFFSHLCHVWEATEELKNWDQLEVLRLAETKYSTDQWTFRR